MAGTFWLYGAWPEAPLDAAALAGRVVVFKSAKTLALLRDGNTLKIYRVSFGPHPTGPKTREGDGKTPEGKYVLDYRNPGSRFHLSLHVSYPSAADTANARQAGVAPGGNIMVHGLRNGLGWIGRWHRLWNWTNGCIAVTHREIEEIWRAVPDGTSIEIRP